MSITAGVKRRRRRSSTVSAAVLAIVALVITGFAINFRGLSSSDVEVSNGGVWVMNEQERLMGRLNVAAQELDARLAQNGDDLELLQAGYTVIETGPRGMTPINTAAVSRNAMVELPPNSQVRLGGDRVAIAAPDGRLWILSPDEAAAFSAGSVEPTHESKSGDLQVAVSTAGTVFLLEGDSLLVFPRNIDTRKTTAEDPIEVGGLSTEAGTVELTAVGEEPVILDRAQRMLRIGTKHKEYQLTEYGVADLGSARIQQPSPASENVVLATQDSLFVIPLNGGSAQVHPARGTGTPVAPAQAKGCAYGAWNESLAYVRACGDKVISESVPDAKSDGALVLRVNHDLVVLNDQKFGLSWMIGDEMQLVDEWLIEQDIEMAEAEVREKKTLTTTITNVAAERDEQNRKPVAVDDQFGVRAGKSVVLPVTRNDNDPDGDILTVTVEGEQPSVGTVTPIQGGTQLQIVVNDDATGTATFSYRVDDGRKESDTATVTLDVKPSNENGAPEPSDQMVTKVQVRSGEEVSFNVLPYWQDPDGDAFYLANATVEPEDVVTFRADGLVTFTDAGIATGEKDVQLTFRDEHGMQGEGTLKIEAVAENDLAPITTADHVRIVAGRTATIKPLANDLNPNGGQLELTNVSEAEALTVDAALEAGTVNVAGDAPGTYYLEYTVAASSSSSASLGIIRVDVVEPSSEQLLPVAVDDMGTVTTGADTLVDPLENDVDPTGGVLVVNSVTVPEGSGLKVTVVAHSLVRVEAEPGAVVSEEPVALTYQVANSAGTAEGTIRVMVASTDTQFADPIGVPDRATVRAGDMVVVNVLSNDISPTDSKLSLGQELDGSQAEGKGRVETLQDQVRFIADDDASGEAVIKYEAVDETGRKGGANLTLRIIPADASNAPPRPENLIARTVAGTTVRIPVPTTGIDPDGDSVMLMGVTSPTPQLGEVVSATGEWIEYVPHENSVGTERFRYQVMDRQGAVGTAEVLVGIAEPNEMNQPPYAVDDIVEVRPDREVQVHALDNDTDPEGTPLSIVPADTEALSEIHVHGEAENAAENMVTATTPSENGTYQVLYSASDGQLKSSATVTLKVDENAPFRSPIARDDFVSAADVLDPEAEAIEVDVLANDSDPDGSTANLTVTLEGSPEGVEIVEGGIVRVTPQDEQQRYRYEIQDADDRTSNGYIWVPGRAKQAPVWVGETIQVQAGSETTIDLSDPQNIRVRPGAESARVTDPDLVVARGTDGTQLVQDESTLLYRAAEDFSGPDTISVEVTDGEVGDPMAATATLAIPVEVAAEDENLPPTLQGALMEVEQGGPQTSVDLAASASDPEDDELTFALGAYTEDPEVTIGLDGTSVTAQATPQATKGTIISVPVTVTDGTNDPVEATVQITVGGSSRPLLTTVLDTAVIDAGTTDSVPVLANDSNPFPGGNRTITNAVATSGTAEVAVEGENVVITPAADFNGILTVVYTVRDDTEDPDRDVPGEIQVTVRGKPDAPLAPRVAEVGDGMVDLNFTGGDDNGAPITGYRVTTASGPAVSQDCPSTSCTITGLTNDVEYTFQVISINEVGESEPSAPSAPARPDVRPEAPGPPSATRGDTSLTVTWAAPANRGSAIQRYDLQMQNTVTGELTEKNFEGGVTQHVWEGLSNGTDYKYRVRAHNLAPEPSEWSSWSVAEHPAGRPGKPAGAITAERVNNPLGGGVKVTWPAMTTAEANGEPITEYIVRASNGVSATVNASTRSHTFRGLDQDTEFTFTYTGVNSVGEGVKASAPSNPVTPWAVPAAPTGVQASMPDEGAGNGPNGRATVTWDAATGNGTRIEEYVVTWSGGGRREVKAPATSLEVTGLDNGTSYAFQVQARNRFKGGESKVSKASNSVKPYTKPDPPVISTKSSPCTDANTCPVTFTMTANGSDGGAGGKTLQYRVDGGGWENARNTSYTREEKLGSGESRKIDVRVRTVSKSGREMYSEERSATGKASTYTPPDPQVAGGGPNWGGKVPPGTSGCSSDNCYYFTITLQNLQPGQTYTVVYKNVHPNGQFREWASFDLNAGADGRATTPTRFYGHWADTGNPNVVYVSHGSNGQKEVGRYYSPD
ncbi:Ig-like domain-containing protein [Brachybacterium muris]|uniref:Ig-like domain-containing protein n=1 Tax=Brachybacterium muris TaxID=219301 RepID=UPI001EF7931A|nr:Ig-like domain-containing protein [Brachybacterium muris]MBM7501397.1 hypothetical protein [Brachybacterium muris]MCT1998781.1 Ig-like domain-containing protein [Brachybacterium muris]